MRKQYSSELNAKTYIDNSFDDVWNDITTIKIATTCLIVIAIWKERKKVFNLVENIKKFINK